MADHDHMLSLRCAVCSHFKERLISKYNYHPTSFEETTNVQATVYKEHAATDTHTCTMGLFKKQHAIVCEYVLITKALLQPSMDDTTRADETNVWNSLHDCQGEAVTQEIIAQLILAII